MTTFGIDCISSPPVADLQANNVSFVCRYLSEVNSLTEEKLLTLGEAKTLSQGGMQIVSNFEWTADRSTQGYDAGVYDAQLARNQHTSCGGSQDRPIYFSVDGPYTLAEVAPYFHGVVSVLGLSRSAAYGSYLIIQSLFNANLISWGWQTYAWSGGFLEPRSHIYQYSNGQSMGEKSVDYDHGLKDDIGGWKIMLTWQTPQQEAQALATWNSTTLGAIGTGGNTLAETGIFPAGKTPSYDTGIANWWKERYMSGVNLGAPQTYEFDSVNGNVLTDWTGENIVQQNFPAGRVEYNVKAGTINFYHW